MSSLRTIAATAFTLVALVGCSGDDGDATGQDPASRPPASSQSPGTTTPPTVGTYPELDAQDYTYVLEQVCFCPITGPVEITVEDGEVASAVLVKGAPGISKGSEAPDYLWVTINDVIARANDTEADRVEVDWPEGQAWPSSVAVDKVERATDDEVTFLVRRVQLEG